MIEKSYADVPVANITVPENRLRAYRDPGGLAKSIEVIGLLHPITITQSGRLVSGRHRLEAVKTLGWETIPVFVVEDDEFLNRIYEIDENLKRLDLTELERDAHYAEREKIMKARGERRGDGRHPNPAKLAGLKTTEEVAEESGEKSERTYQRRKSIGQRIPEDLREEILDAYYQPDSQCNLADNQKQLNYLAGVDDPDEQREIAHKVLSGEAGDVFQASDKLKKAKRKTERDAEAERKRQEFEAMPQVVERRYSVIYADPPWQYEHDVTDSRSVENQYPTMSLEAIKAVDTQADDDAMLFLWVPIPLIQQGLSVITAWGFDYRTAFVWDKEKMGMGYYVRQQCEMLLIAMKGHVHAPEPKARPRSLLRAKPGKHSEKPEQVYELIEEMYPLATRRELFARQAEPRDGWDAWGYEAPQEILEVV